jgi:hypothetical protein
LSGAAKTQKSRRTCPAAVRLVPKTGEVIVVADPENTRMQPHRLENNVGVDSSRCV